MSRGLKIIKKESNESKNGYPNDYGLDRRQAPRYACHIPAVIRKGTRRFKGVITNISVGGVEIRLDSPIHLQEFVIDFKLNNMILSIFCEAVAMRENEEQEIIMHTKFLIIPTEVRKYFTDFLVTSEIRFRPVIDKSSNF